jgi:hypothetical protein
MRTPRYTDEQLPFALKQAELGTPPGHVLCTGKRAPTKALTRAAAPCMRVVRESRVGLAAGTTPKEQPPRKLSGSRTATGLEL